MKIGMLGAGKLGLPVALAIESKGHEVLISDLNEDVGLSLDNKSLPNPEKGVQELLDNTNIRLVSLGNIVEHSDILFVAVQTPHDPQYEGDDKLPTTRSDFDYTYLASALMGIASECDRLKKKLTVAVISTCLPGTFQTRIKPALNNWVRYVYSPQFIAMGTVLEDYLNPEFNLIGVESVAAADQLERFYASINDAPNLRTDITTAEGIKVSYNTWITAKTVIANIWGEIAERTGMNFDDLYKAWGLSTKRIISTKYMRAGMGDGGGCHPRDNIALSWLARKENISHDIFSDLMNARQDFEDHHARKAIATSMVENLKLILLGKAFKPETNIQTGSPAILMANILRDYGFPFEHYEDLDKLPKAVYFIATDHKRYRDYRFPTGSVVIDPFKARDL